MALPAAPMTGKSYTLSDTTSQTFLAFNSVAGNAGDLGAVQSWTGDKLPSTVRNVWVMTLQSSGLWYIQEQVNGCYLTPDYGIFSNLNTLGCEVGAYNVMWNVNNQSSSGSEALNITSPDGKVSLEVPPAGEDRAPGVPVILSSDLDQTWTLSLPASSDI